MSEHQNSAVQKMVQPASAETHLMDMENTPTIGGFAAADSISLEQGISKPASVHPAGIQRQLDRLHGVQAQNLVMRAANLYGNKVAGQIIQRHKENNVRTPSSAASAPSQVIQRTAYMGNFGGNWMDTALTNLTSDKINLPNLTSTPQTGNVTNIPNLNSTTIPIRNSGDKPDTNKDITPLPVGKPDTNKDFGAIITNSPVTGNNSVSQLNNASAITNQPHFLSMDQLPSLPVGTRGVTVPDGTIGTPEFGQVIGPDGNPQSLVILAPQGLNGNPRGTLLSLDGRQVLNHDVANPSTGVPAVSSSPIGSTNSVSAVNSSPVGSTSNLSTGVPAISSSPIGSTSSPPVTIPGYDRGSLLDQLPKQASIRLIIPAGDAVVSPSPVPGLPASAVGIVTGAGGKDKAYISLQKVGDVEAGTLFSLKFPDQVIGSAAPGSANNPFKPTVTPIQPATTNVGQDVSTGTGGNGGLLDGIVSDMDNNAIIKSGEGSVEVAANPPSPTPGPSPSPAPGWGGKVTDFAKTIYDKLFPQKAPEPAKVNELVQIIQAASANGKYPVKVEISGNLYSLDTSGKIGISAPIPNLPLPGGEASISSTVTIDGRTIVVTPVFPPGTTATNPGNQRANFPLPTGFSSWTGANSATVPNNIPPAFRTQLNTTLNQPVSQQLLQAGVAQGWAKLVEVAPATGAIYNAYVIRDGAQFIIINSGIVKGIAPIGSIQIRPR